MFKKFTYGTLDNHPEQIGNVISLIEKSFDYNGENSFVTDFFPLINKSNHKNCHVLIDGETVIGHIGVCLRQLGNNSFKIPVATIGGIAISDNFRGMGLYKKMMNDVLNKYSNKVGLFLLWSDLDSLYEKFGFFQAGEQVETGNLPFPSAGIDGFEKTTFGKISNYDLEAIRKIYDQETCRNYITFLRSDNDWLNIRKMVSIDLYIKKDDSNKIIGYFCVNKGQDLTDIIHEVGTITSYKEEFFKKLNQLKFWTPDVHLSDVSENSRAIYLGLFKIGNTELLNKFIVDLGLIEDRNDSRKMMDDFLKHGPSLYFSGLDTV